MFHFNKKHLEDQTIPPWVLKFHGETYYVNHVECNVPWSTKETPENSHTKGSIKVKNCLLTIDENNSASISKLTLIDKVRLRNQRLGITRIIVKEGVDNQKFIQSLKHLSIKHGPIKKISGACSSTFYVCDILDKTQFTMLSLSMSNASSFRVLMPNEAYYKWYDDPKNANRETIWEEDQEYDDDE